MVTVFRDCSHGFGTHLIWILHFLPPYSPVPFFRRWKLTLKTKKPLSLYGRTAEYRELEVSALFENEKAGILMASHHKKPGRVPNDKFPKTL